MKGDNLSELYPGHAYLISENNAKNTLKLASKLFEIEHKLMIISDAPTELTKNLGLSFKLLAN